MRGDVRRAAPRGEDGAPVVRWPAWRPDASSASGLLATNATLPGVDTGFWRAVLYYVHTPISAVRFFFTREAINVSAGWYLRFTATANLEVQVVAYDGGGVSRTPTYLGGSPSVGWHYAIVTYEADVLALETDDAPTPATVACVGFTPSTSAVAIGRRSLTTASASDQAAIGAALGGDAPITAPQLVALRAALQSGPNAVRAFAETSVVGGETFAQPQVDSAWTAHSNADVSGANDIVSKLLTTDVFYPARKNW